mgnify:FL=1
MHGNLEPEENVFPKEGSLSVVVPIDDFRIMLRQMWKSRGTEPIIGKLYEKYTELTTFE